MKYSILDLIQPINTLNNIGSITLEKLNKYGIKSIIDLLFYFPINVVSRNKCSAISELKIKESCIIELIPISYHKKQKSTIVLCLDSNNKPIKIIFFNLYKNYIEKYLPLNKKLVIIGTPELYQGELVINHPDKILSNIDINKIDTIDVVYKAHQDITSYKFKTYIQQALQILQNIELLEWLEDSIINKYQLPTFYEALYNIHNPININSINPNNPSILRLAIDEMLCYHLILLKARSNEIINSGISIISNNSLIKPLMKHLPFKLTQDQISAIKEIKLDLSLPTQTTILLQGDVGSGKTIVCFIASLFALENNYQVAFMAPTEILAQQHFYNLSQYAKILNIEVSLLRGKETAKNKQNILRDLKSNKIQILVGTHSLFQDSVDFHNLGLIIIDEQHRFGVNQRIKLASKGNNPNLILTTATPIPRSLALTYYGDIKSLEIKEKPQNRKEIITQVMHQNKINDIFNKLDLSLTNKEKIFWVCPLVEESQKLDLTSATLRFESLIERFKNYKIYLVHGKIKADEKDKIITEFKNLNEGAILVATTVIEVGIDIPSCNIMIIENAERFGLAQLHQLRGRVGRGDIQGVCLLLYGNNTSITSKNRLSVLKKSNDGFYIAEQDLKIRGYGDILGTNQSGYAYFKIANLEFHNEHLLDIIKYAKFVFYNYNTNPNYTNKINYLLKIFNKYQEFYLKA